MTSTSYHTTRPILPPSSSRQPVQFSVSETLLELRPIQSTDLEFMHALRTQEAVMVNTSSGKVSPNISATQTWLNLYLPPNDAKTYNFSLWTRQGSSWEHIGVLGSHILDPVPHIGYMIRTEWWGKGIMSKAVAVFCNLWWELERKGVTVELNTGDAHQQHLVGLEYSGQSDGKVPEILLAEIESNNVGSRRVVERCGFVKVSEEKVKDHDDSPEDQLVILEDWILSRAS